MRCEQLDMLLEWGAEFKRATSGPTDEEKVLEDQVAFDVILGDLNFDNCSSGTSIFSLYTLATKKKYMQQLGLMYFSMLTHSMNNTKY